MKHRHTLTLAFLIAILLAVLHVANASHRLESATLAADGASATLTISEQVGANTFYRGMPLEVSALDSSLQAALGQLLGALSLQLPEGFERGMVVVERTRDTVPAVLAEDEVTVLLPELPRVGVAVYGSHPTLGSTVISTAGGTLTVTPENNAALLGLLDTLEASTEQ